MSAARAGEASQHTCMVQRGAYSWQRWAWVDGCAHCSRDSAGRRRDAASTGTSLAQTRYGAGCR
eukprot:scaffold15918_cov73-Phaeocystis_antarctica.AAC.4